MDTVLFFILLVSEILKIPRAKVKARFLKKLAFVTSKEAIRLPRCIASYKQALS